MKPNRTVIVRDLLVESISNASVVQVGDSAVIRPWSRALAVQREIAFFLPNEGGFSNFPIFSVPLPQLPIDTPVRLTICNENPVIHVDGIDVTGVAASSVVKLGNTRRVDAEARLLHIRQLLRGERPVGPAGDEDDED